MTEPQPKMKYQSLQELEKTKKPVRRYQDMYKTTYQEHVYLNEYQYELYNAAIYGLKAFNPKKLSPNKRQKIEKLYSRAQRVLNLWKQELINQRFHSLFDITFTKFAENPFKKVFNGTKITNIDRIEDLKDEEVLINLTFDQLRINRKQIIYKLITSGIFPENFLTLSKL